MYQLAKEIFLSNLSSMKSILKILEFKYGKENYDYIYLKEQIMKHTYDSMKKLFKLMEERKILIRCECKANLRQGFKKCLCGGSGYRNK